MHGADAYGSRRPCPPAYEPLGACTPNRSRRARHSTVTPPSCAFSTRRACRKGHEQSGPMAPALKVSSCRFRRVSPGAASWQGFCSTCCSVLHAGVAELCGSGRGGTSCVLAEAGVVFFRLMHGDSDFAHGRREGLSDDWNSRLALCQRTTPASKRPVSSSLVYPMRSSLCSCPLPICSSALLALFVRDALNVRTSRGG